MKDELEKAGPDLSYPLRFPVIVHRHVAECTLLSLLRPFEHKSGHLYGIIAQTS